VKDNVNVNLRGGFCLIPKLANSQAIHYRAKNGRYANDNQAIQVLLVSDGLFRSSDIAERRKHVALVESAEANGAEIRCAPPIS
jgi:stalled ribosome rescue protein Dom34